MTDIIAGAVIVNFTYKNLELKNLFSFRDASVSASYPGAPFFYRDQWQLINAKRARVLGQHGTNARVLNARTHACWPSTLARLVFSRVDHWHILIWTACCNTCWLKACVANWSWRIWEWLLMGYNADHTHLSSNMSHDLHSFLCKSVDRCCWSDFVYFKVTQYINPSKPSSRYFRWKCWSFHCLYFR